MSDFHLAEVDVRWTGVDDSTPPGCCLANVRDQLGNYRLCLFRGAEPSDDGFLGSILIPTRAGVVAVAYGPTGAYVTSNADGSDTSTLLNTLVARADARHG